MEDILQLLGVEHELDHVNTSLRRRAASYHAPVVGAMEITCADESECECVDSFQRCVVNDLLPDLKPLYRSAFRLANLGARYETGAIAVAEHHFATASAQTTFKVLLVKVNSHVAVQGSGPAMQFGKMLRYDAESTACGALHAMLGGGDLPFIRELRASFQSMEWDRVAVLNDPSVVDPALRSLFVAITHARLQLAAVTADVQRHHAHGPTVYVLTGSVTLNRPGRDTEIPIGLHLLDHRGAVRGSEYTGLGDDPRRYRVRHDGGRLRVSEE